jgi:hypothetical protein
MQIHQFNVSHNDRQDRLLLRVNTQTEEEFRFWLTRRLALRLVPALEQSVAQLESSQPQMMAHDRASQQILTDLKRDAFMQNADFDTPYSGKARQLPLGEEPMLVTDVELKLKGSGVQLTLQDKGAPPGEAQHCQLNLPPSLLHGLIHLLMQAMVKAQWQTSSELPVAPDETLLPDMPPASGYRH